MTRFTLRILRIPARTRHHLAPRQHEYSSPFTLYPTRRQTSRTCHIAHATRRPRAGFQLSFDLDDFDEEGVLGIDDPELLINTPPPMMYEAWEGEEKSRVGV